ncbi:MAG TPA: hypothetical protein VFF69_12545 [Phycisphaerales bacterium]|nr:hypothetical protein [Phycisphaerales bacterium]
METHASAWDRLQGDWSALTGAPLPSRTEGYDALLARGEQLAPGMDAYPAARLARDYASRLSYWRERLAWGRDGAGDATAPLMRALLEAGRYGGAAGAVVLIAFAAWRGSAGMALAAAVGVAASVAVHVRAARRAGRPELGEALARGLCPDCGYELGGLPPALPREVLAGLDVGPASCPECGGRWPRVPPPAPRRGGSPDEA